MLRILILAISFVITAGCSSSDDGNASVQIPSQSEQPVAPETPASPETPAENPEPTTEPETQEPAPVLPTGDPVPPSGGTAGVWIGPTDFGIGVYVIDSAGTLNGFSSDGDGKFKSLFGPIDGLLERFDHRSSDNAELGDAHTVVGDPDQEYASLSYLFAVSEDGRSLYNTSALGEFTMSLAGDNSITVNDIAGSWVSKTAFCATCPLQVYITITADGLLSGHTSFGLEGSLDPANNIPLSGSVTGEGQYLDIEFSWDGKIRTGVAYREFATQKLMINTVGVESAEDGNRAFSALMTRATDEQEPTPPPSEPPAEQPTEPTTQNPGEIAGFWSGPTDFGTGIYIIDSDQDLFGFSSDGAGKFKSLFGPTNGLIERFDHRISENTQLGDAYTVVGDPDQQYANLSYQFSLSEDGRSLTNTSALGSFTMSRADDNPITIADVIGNWQSRTAFCPNCPLLVDMTFSATGEVTGSTSFGTQGSIDPATRLNLNGNLTEAEQFLGISFSWDGKIREGVIYRDSDPQKLVLNTVGVESAEAGNRAFSALLTRQ